MWEWQVKFYWRQNEDCSARDSSPDSSETAAERQGGGQYTCGFGEGVVNTIENIFFQEVSISFMKFASHE